MSAFHCIPGRVRSSMVGNIHDDTPRLVCPIWLFHGGKRVEFVADVVTDFGATGEKNEMRLKFRAHTVATLLTLALSVATDVVREEAVKAIAPWWKPPA